MILSQREILPTIGILLIKNQADLISWGTIGWKAQPLQIFGRDFQTCSQINLKNSLRVL
jgi:hypothetical protein